MLQSPSPVQLGGLRWATVFHYPSYAGEPRTRHSTPDVVSPMLNKGEGSLPAGYIVPNTTQDAVGLLQCQSTLLTCSTCFPLGPPGLFMQSCFLDNQSTACTGACVYPSLGAGLFICFC